MVNLNYLSTGLRFGWMVTTYVEVDKRHFALKILQYNIILEVLCCTKTNKLNSPHMGPPRHSEFKPENFEYDFKNSLANKMLCFWGFSATIVKNIMWVTNKQISKSGLLRVGILNGPYHLNFRHRVLIYV